MIGGETLKTALLAIRLFLSLHLGSLNPLLLRRDPLQIPSYPVL
jgi:hypothetical protein